jgi:hypothetical protein
VGTHIVQIGHIQDNLKVDKMLGDPGVCHHCYSPAKHFLTRSITFPLKQGKARFRKVVEVAARHSRHIGSDNEGKYKWLGIQQAYANARNEAGGVHLVFNPLPGSTAPLLHPAPTLAVRSAATAVPQAACAVKLSQRFALLSPRLCA